MSQRKQQHMMMPTQPVELDQRGVVHIASEDQPDFRAGKLFRDSMMRRKAKSKTIGSLLPSLMVVLLQLSLEIWVTSSLTLWK